MSQLKTRIAQAIKNGRVILSPLNTGDAIHGVFRLDGIEPIEARELLIQFIDDDLEAVETNFHGYQALVLEGNDEDGDTIKLVVTWHQDWLHIIGAV